MEVETLIRRCQQGDREAMGALYTAMHDELMVQCRQYTADDSMAEDLLHDAFLLIFRNIKQVRSPEKGRQWMHKVARNVCLIYMQQRRNHPQLSIEEVREATQVAEPAMPFVYDEVMNAIEKLPRGYRQVFRLSVLEGMSHQQIADLLGIEPHSSSSQLLRAKRQLRQMLRVLMLALLAAIPVGGYYLWTLHDNKEIVRQPQESGAKVASTDMTEGQDPRSAERQRTTAHKGSDPRVRPASHEGLTPCEPGKPQPKPVADVEVEMVRAHKGSDPAMRPASHEGLTPCELTPCELRVPQKALATEKVSLSLAYSGLPNGTARQLPFGAEGMNDDIDSVTHHRMPVTIALNARYAFSPKWWLEGGLRYTLLSSETRIGNTYLQMERHRRVRYLGLTLGVGRSLWQRSRWNLYTTAALSLELPLRSTQETSYWRGGSLMESESIRLKPHAQWSIGAGIGLQYSLTPAVGCFVEPSLQYYFRSSDGIDTWRTAHPLTPMLPLGIRITF